MPDHGLQNAGEVTQTCARATLFGTFRLKDQSGREVIISNRRAKALLAMLCLEAGEPIERELLSRLLWPGRYDAHAKASLRQCLLDLGKLLEPLGSQILDVSRSRVRLNVDAIQTDLLTLETALVQHASAVAAEQLALIGASPLLDQFEFGDAFKDWLVQHRSAVEQRLHQAVSAELARLMREGDRDGHSSLLDAWSARNPTAWRIGEAGKVRIAVLPFAPIEVREGQTYFADGLVDELITTLGQVAQLLVAGRTSSFHFRDSDLAPSEIASALRVSHLVEGTVQREGEMVRIFVRLIDGTNGFEIWGRRYDGSLDHIFALQENVAQAVTAAIGSALGITMQPPLVQGMTHSKEAYDLYLQGRALGARLFGDGVLDNAVALLDQAVALDPQFAEAWLLLAEVHQLIGIYTACLDRAAASARMAECVSKALAIKPNLAQAHVLLGLHEMERNNFVGALDMAFKGYAIEPGNPAVSMRLGSYLLFCGRTADGMRYVNEAIAQDPIDGRKYMLRSAANFNCGQIEAAIADGQRAVDLGFPSMFLAVATAAAGQHDLAVEQYRQTRLLLNKTIFPPAGTAPMPPEVMDAYWLVAAKGVCSGKAEDRAAYCQTLDYLHATMYDSSDMSLALPAVFMGYADILFKMLSERMSLGNFGCLMSIWADIEPIRQIWQHPEFIPFAQRIGMAAAWDKYGWPDLLPAPSNQAAPG